MMACSQIAEALTNIKYRKHNYMLHTLSKEKPHHTNKPGTKTILPTLLLLQLFQSCAGLNFSLNISITMIQ